MSNIAITLATYSRLNKWKPKHLDFIIYHGWFRGRWYGLVSGIHENELIIIKESLPHLLFTLDENDYPKHTINVPISKVINSSYGTYCVLQDGVWYL